LTCIDIAGLTAGASTGAGLGNAFLSHVRAVDGIFQMVRAFDDADVIHVEGDVDPTRDMAIIQNELRLKDIEWVQKYLEQMKKTVRSAGSVSLADKAKKEELATVEKILHVLTEEKKDVRKINWTNKEVSNLFLCRNAKRQLCPCPVHGYMMRKSTKARFNPAR
jgi:obg-like ATPase 1